MSDTPLPIAVLISGSGSNLQALLDSPAHGIDFIITVVVSDRLGVRGLVRAKEASVDNEVVALSDFETRSEFTAALCDVAEKYGARALLLAGFMRVLAPNAIERFPDAIINVHPALLPAFPGAHAVDDAIAYGVTLTGVTIHFVDAQVDHGPIIHQEAVTVLPTDDAASLHERIQAVEHRVLPGAVAAYAQGVLTVEGRYVRWDDKPREAITR